MGCGKKKFVSDKQRKFVYMLRDKYKTKKETPDKYKWIWKFENIINNKEEEVFMNKRYLREEIEKGFTIEDEINLIKEYFGVELKQSVLTDSDSQFGFNAEDNILKYVDDDGKLILYTAMNRIKAWYYLFFKFNGNLYLIYGDSYESLKSDLDKIVLIVNEQSSDINHNVISNDVNDKKVIDGENEMKESVRFKRFGLRESLRERLKTRRFIENVTGADDVDDAVNYKFKVNNRENSKLFYDSIRGKFKRKSSDFYDSLEIDDKFRGGRKVYGNKNLKGRRK